MTDINRMNGINNVQNVQHLQNVNKNASMESQENSKKIDLDSLRGPADVVGRSQIKKADNVKEDVNFMLRNPEIMAKAERFFEMAYERLLKEDSPNAYEKASAMATVFARELASK